KQLQDKLNSQSDSQNGNGNGAHKAPSQTGGLSTQITTDNIDPLSRPFVESDKLDEQQILTGEGGNAHYLGCVTELKANIKKYTRKQQKQIEKLQEYVISYKGIMKLAEKHGIEYSVSLHNETNTVIAKAMNGNERVSGKPVNGSVDTAIELAKRNAARQLLPLAEIKAIEYKAKLEAEFDWKTAYEKCAQVAGTKANVDITINELVKSGKLRADNPSGYNRTEYLLIYQACKNDQSNDDNNDGGDNAPSSNDDEVNLYKVLAEAEVNPNFQQRYDECVKLVGMDETDLIIWQRLNFRYSYYKNKITDDQWDVVLQECQWRWNARQAKAEFASAQQEYKLNHIRWKTGYDVRSKKYVGRPPVNDEEFIKKCKDAIEQVRTEKSIEANELPLESATAGGQRRLQMDSKLRTWLIEADGTKKPISCREIAEQFDSYGKGIITRLRTGIESGADISTVEID
ncbi:MAG: hypothetical protein ACYS6K_23735, partial [Planctomycetota bacterium]